MTQEQKAKAYDEAKYIMKEYLESGNAGVIAENTIKKAFPELAESEDERIRKWLIYYFKEACDNVSEKEKKGVLAWLENQGEQKLAEWHREDEQNLNACLGYIQDEFLRRWLTDVIHARYDKSPWTEEDKRRMNNLYYFLEEYGGQYYGELTLKDMINWFNKSLRPQNNITDEELAQAKKDSYNDALDKIEYHSGEPTFNDGWDAVIWYLKKRNVLR